MNISSWVVSFLHTVGKKSEASCLFWKSSKQLLFSVTSTQWVSVRWNRLTSSKGILLSGYIMPAVFQKCMGLCDSMRLTSVAVHSWIVDWNIFPDIKLKDNFCIFFSTQHYSDKFLAELACLVKNYLLILYSWTLWYSLIIPTYHILTKVCDQIFRCQLLVKNVTIKVKVSLFL